MKRKLTLSMGDSVVDAAKAYARKNEKSLSGLVENYLKSITNAEPTTSALSPKVAKLWGAIKLPDDFDYEKYMTQPLKKR